MVAEVSLKFSFGAIDADINVQCPAVCIRRRRDSEAVSRAVNGHASSGGRGGAGRYPIATTDFRDVVIQALRVTGSERRVIAELLRASRVVAVTRRRNKSPVGP